MPGDTEAHRVSVILRTRNESRHLAHTLQAIRKQRSSGALQIIVIDSESTDGTPDIARGEADIFLSLKMQDFSFGRALNYAAQHATGNILVILSAHAQPAHPGWLTKLISRFDNPCVGGVYGKQTPYPDAWPPVIVDYTTRYGNQEVIHKSANDVFFSNANAALRKRLWERIPFEENIPACEDQVWARQAVNLGYWIVYEPHAEVYHSHNEGIRALYRRRAREEKGWREIFPHRKGSFHLFLDDWYTSTKRDVTYIMRNRKAWRWLFRSPYYRFFWAAGQWYPYW